MSKSELQNRKGNSAQAIINDPNFVFATDKHVAHSMLLNKLFFLSPYKMIFLPSSFLTCHVVQMPSPWLHFSPHARSANPSGHGGGLPQAKWTSQARRVSELGVLPQGNDWSWCGSRANTKGKRGEAWCGVVSSSAWGEVRPTWYTAVKDDDGHVRECELARCTTSREPKEGEEGWCGWAWGMTRDRIDGEIGKLTAYGTRLGLTSALK